MEVRAAASNAVAIIDLPVASDYFLEIAVALVTNNRAWLECWIGLYSQQQKSSSNYCTIQAFKCIVPLSLNAVVTRVDVPKLIDHLSVFLLVEYDR